MEESIAAMFIKNPAFMHVTVVSWFTICEAQFELRHISNKNARFYHVFLVLPPKLMSNLPSIIVTSKQCTELKNTVVTMHRRTKPEIFAKLISNTQMTGRLEISSQVNSNSEQKVLEMDSYITNSCRRYILK